MIRIREAVDGDCEELSRLNQAFNGVTRTIEQIEGALRDDRSTETVLVAEESGVVVGFACLHILRSYCYGTPWMEITELFVAPSHRRSGAGAGLVDDAIRRAGQAGASEVLVRTNAKNEAAKALFILRGLKPAPDMVFHRLVEPA